MSFHYSSDSKESLRDYIEKSRSRVNPTFIGVEPFRELWNLGYIEPYIAAIRLFSDGPSYDQWYGVVSENELEGIQKPAHSGKPGIHNVEKILTQEGFSYWEAESLNPDPEPRI